MSSTREALVIGINYYPGFTTLDNLTAAVKDANSIATLLEKYGYETFRVQRLPRELNQKGESLAKAEESAVKASELKTAIENLFNPPPPNEPPEMGLFFFSGHGWRKSINGKEEVFLATSDVLPEEEEYGVSLSWLGKQLQNSPVKKIIVWLDSCLSGELLTYIDEIPPDKDFCLITATRSYEPGLEQRHEQGLFTKYLTAGINPQHSPGGIVDSHKLTKYIQSEMAQTSQAPQIAVSEKTILLTSKVRKKAFQDQCPYRSLDFFTESPEDAVVFHGRTKLVRALVKRVMDKERLIGVLGHSGSGKSSLLRAGLLYQLKLGQMIPGSNNWLYLDPFTPTTEPLQKLEQAFGHKVEPRQDSATPIILIIDQFEECFTMCEEAIRTAFIEKIQTLLVELPRLQIILGMRSDFRKEWRDFPQFNQQISKFNVEKLNSEEIREAIEKPAEWVGLGIESELKQKLISDVEDYPESLPLLQYTLTELWKKSREQGEKFLRLETYKALGGIEGTLEQRADEVYASLSPINQQVAKRIFLELTQMGSIAGTRRRVRLAELANSHHSYEELDQVAHILANQENRLITRTEEEDSIVKDKDTKNNHRGAVMLEVVHEALIRDWRQLGDWQKEYRDGMIAERKIETAAHEWLNSKKDPDYLLQGARLSVGESYLETYGKLGMLDGLAEEFILASQNLRTEKETEEDRRRQAEINNLKTLRQAEEKARKEAEQRELDQRRTNKLIIFSTLALFSTILASTFAFGFHLNSKKANIKQQAANIKLKLSVSNEIEHLLESIELVGDNRRLLKLSAEPFSEVQSVLYQATEDSKERSTFNNHQKSVNSVGFSPDGKYLVSGSSDKTVKLWSVSTQALIHTFNGHQSEVRSVSFSRDGKYIVSGSSDKTVKLWSVETQALIYTFNGHESEVRSVSFSRDGKYIVSGSSDKTVKLWSVSNKSLIRIFNGHQSGVFSVGFSPDGKYLASGSHDNTVKLWDVNPQSLTHTFKGHESGVFSVGFSPDGKYLVSGSYDKTVKLWSVSNKSLIHNFNGHQSAIFSVGFSPDGKHIVSGSFDKTVKLWSVETQTLIHTFNGHESEVRSVSFSSDGKYIVSGSDDNTVKLWSVSNKSLIHTFNGHESKVRSVSFSRDGKYIVSGSDDNTVRLWSVSNKSLIHPFDGHESHESRVRSVSFSPNGKYIVSSSDDNTVKLWSVKTQTLIHTFNGHQSGVRSVSFSPNGKYIVSGSFDNTMKLWSVSNKSLIHTFNGHQSEVRSVSFSPDGKYIVSGSFDNTVKLWLGSDWRNWLQAGCEKIKLHPIFLVSSEIDSALKVKNTCFKYVGWSNKQKAEFYLMQGKNLAQNADVKGAKEKLQQARKLDPNNNNVNWSKLEAEIYQSASQALLRRGKNQVLQGNITNALSLYKKAQSIYPGLKIEAESWNTLCWFGSIYGSAKEVLFACEKAVELAPDENSKAQYLNSRGLAKVLAINSQEVITDFPAYVNPLELYEEYQTQRKEWIELLTKGEITFTDEVLESLKNQ